jgi:hypothetical protein
MQITPWLSKAAKQLRDQVDTWYPDRDTASDGWVGDSRHATTKSDHNPDTDGCVRAIDIDIDLAKQKGLSVYLSDQIRICAKTDKRISYVIHNGMIASKIFNFKWRKYSGFNKHTKHIHISFTKAGDQDGKAFDIPLLGGKI